MANSFLKNLARLYLPLYQYESEAMKIVFAGYSSIKRDYFFRLLPEGNCHQTFLGKRWFWQIPSAIESYNIDLIISEVSSISTKYFQNENGYMLPVWVAMRINIDRPLDEIFKRSNSHFSDVLKRIRKYNLTYEMLTDEADFNYFNDKLYLPYVTNRHGEEAIVTDLKKIWKSSQSPALMAIKEDGKIVAGSLINKTGDCLQGLRLGILDGNEEYLRHGVVGAIYYYGILEGHKMGCRYLNVGTSRSFLYDGLTKYKMGLGAEFIADKATLKECLWLGFNQQSIAAKEFMRSNPFIFLNKDHKLEKSPL